MNQHKGTKARRHQEGRVKTFLIAAFLVPSCLCAFVLSIHAQAARPIQTVDQMIDALGGQTFLDVKDIHTTGRFFAFSRGELSGGDLFSDYIKFPDMERTEFGSAKNKAITINRGKEGSKVEGKKDPEQQTPGEIDEFIKGFKTSFDYVLRFALSDRQTTVQNLPSEVVDFKRTNVVELRDAAKNRIRFYVDRDTHLPVKMQVRRNDDSKLREEQYANWHKFQGVMTPLYVSRSTDGLKTMEIRVETAVYNSGLAETLFTQLTPAK